MTFFNENDPFPAEWLKNLYPTAAVDSRSIVDIHQNDVAGAKRAHFFAGIGGWEYALKLAGWPADREVWTGSCPCQPFSAAGKQKGTADERHLWPELRRLIAECRPATIFGEQVASRLGREWLAGVRADLEALGYAVGAADLCAAGGGAPHIRQRLWWVANALPTGRAEWRSESGRGSVARSSINGGLAESERDSRGPGRLADESREGAGTESARPSVELGRCGLSCRLGNSDCSGCDGQQVRLRGGRSEQGCVEVAGTGCNSRVGHSKCERDADSRSRAVATPPTRVQGAGGERQRLWPNPWEPSDSLPCLDGKARRIESGTFPLAHGVPARVGRLRAYGNAIVPQVAATFIRAFLDAEVGAA